MRTIVEFGAVVGAFPVEGLRLSNLEAYGLIEFVNSMGLVDLSPLKAVMDASEFKAIESALKAIEAALKNNGWRL